MYGVKNNLYPTSTLIVKARENQLVSVWQTKPESIGETVGSGTKKGFFFVGSSLPVSCQVALEKERYLLVA